MTGGTGFLGRQLVAGLLQQGEEVVALVRGRDDAEAREKVRAALASVSTPGPEATNGRLTVCRGVLGAPGLGLAPGDRDRILATCDRFLHGAATVRFDLPWA